MHLRKLLLASLAVAATLGITTSAAAQVYPSRPITIVVPYTAGGPSDTLARIMAERMRASLGQPIIIDNVGGAAGRIGTGRVARAAPDGYMLCLGSLSTHVVNGAAYALQYDPLMDFEPVSLLPTQSMLIVARKTLQAENLQQLIAWLKAHPGKASQGTTGIGSTSHLAGVFFQKETGTRYQFVPYRGTAMQDLVAGNIDLMIDQGPNSLPHIRSGAVKAYATTAKMRSASAPDIPTVDEAGLPGFYMSHWNAFWVPKGTPKTIIGKLNAAVVEVLADPVMRQRLADIGQEIPSRDLQAPEALRAFHEAEIAKWWPIIKAAGIKAE